jgi:tetratricopeptide (TPR) repeat protein
MVGEDSKEVGRVGPIPRLDDIRSALATTTDAVGRSRLRVRLADMLSALGDTTAALGELKQAVVEAPASAGLLFAIRAIAPRLGSDEVASLRMAARVSRPTKQSHTARSLRSSPQAASTVAPPLVSPAVPPVVPPVPLPVTRSTASGSGAARALIDPIEAAFAALAAHKPIQARRRGEEAARLGDGSAKSLQRLGELVNALDQKGAKREALRLGRALAETDGSPDSIGTTSDALAALVGRAVQAGESELASRWQIDLGWRAPPEVKDGLRLGAHSDGTEWARFRDAQRAAQQMAGSKDIEAVISRLIPLFNSHGGGSAALALAFAEQLADGLEEGAQALKGELLRLAFEGERSARRREKLAIRWIESLKTAGDDVGALAVLGRVIIELPVDRSVVLRRMRVELLRAPDRESDLGRALEADAAVATDTARTALLTEQATLLDRLGEFDSALDVRLGALEDAPGAVGLLAPARQRLEAVGQLDRSLELVTAAIPHVVDRAARAGLLRDAATLAETAAGDRQRAATAWLEVVSLFPGDQAACDAAERLLRQTGDRARLGELLAWSAARQADPQTRAGVLWRLAEFRRVDMQSPLTALPLYREIIEIRGRAPDVLTPLTLTDVDWQRRDDSLSLHSARALAAPTVSARAQALADRAGVLIDAGRLDEADRDLGRALDFDPAIRDVVAGLERLYGRRGDWRGLRNRLASRVEGVSGAATAHLWFGIGRANERLGDPVAARSAYERAVVADDGFQMAVTVLRGLASSRSDFPEVARLLEKEIDLSSTSSERVGLLIELGVLLTDRFDRPLRAVELLDAALAFEPENPAALDAMFVVGLAAGAWEKAAQALEAMLGAGVAVADAAQRYHRLGSCAEQSGQIDRALSLYSRSYARNPVFRPTLERLSQICFERQQWENAWKATEHLIERHGSDLDPDTRANLALRSALADLHVGQRVVATSEVLAMLGGRASSTGLRDVADSWASMRFDPRLLAGVEGDRRARVLSRLVEVMALTESNVRHAARATARETLAALAVVDRRWADALSLLESLGADRGLEVDRRCLFLVLAGDVLVHRQGDVEGAASRYQLAGALNPAEPRLGRAGIASVTSDPPAEK